MQKIFWLLFCFALIFQAKAESIYQPVTAFVKAQFTQTLPSPSVLWLTRDRQSQITQLIGHPYKKLRLHYWRQSNKTVWILDEIGKELPITLGIAVNQGKIQSLKVLVYRESRGDEVRHDFFTRQFINLHLTEHNNLNQQIDGISGATLSVRALKRMAKLALWLDHQVTHED